VPQVRDFRFRATTRLYCRPD